MSVTEYNAFLHHGLPNAKELSTTAHAIFGVFCQRYDTRLNPPRAYPGMAELKRATGKERSTIQDGINDLIMRGLVERVTRGRAGFRAEYVPIYAVRLVATCPLCKSGSHSMARAKSKVTGTPEVVTGTPEVVTGRATLMTGTPVAIDTKDTVIDTYRYVISETIKDNVSTTNRKPKSAPREINYERWNVVTGEISRDVLRLIPPGVNYERLLDKCEVNGWSLSRLRVRLGKINFASAGKCGGLLDHELRVLAGEPALRKPDDKPPNELRSRTTDEVPREMKDFFDDFGKMP